MITRRHQLDSVVPAVVLAMLTVVLAMFAMFAMLTVVVVVVAVVVVMVPVLAAGVAELDAAEQRQDGTGRQQLQMLRVEFGEGQCV